MGRRRLAVFALLMGTVFAETNAGATTLASEQGGYESGHFTGIELCLPVGTLGEVLRPSVPDRLLPLLLLESSPTWLGHLAQPNPTDDTFHIPVDGVPTPSLPVSELAHPQHGATTPEPAEAGYRTRGPALQSADLLAWKLTGDTSPANPEDWLFRLQFTQASSFQAAAPAPLFPIPEPTTGAILLMGLVGTLARRWRA
jgi:hypothetical protein